MKNSCGVKFRGFTNKIGVNHINSLYYKHNFTPQKLSSTGMWYQHFPYCSSSILAIPAPGCTVPINSTGGQSKNAQQLSDTEAALKRLTYFGVGESLPLGGDKLFQNPAREY